MHLKRTIEILICWCVNSLVLSISMIVQGYWVYYHSNKALRMYTKWKFKPYRYFHLYFTFCSTLKSFTRDCLSLIVVWLLGRHILMVSSNVKHCSHSCTDVRIALMLETHFVLCTYPSLQYAAHSHEPWAYCYVCFPMCTTAILIEKCVQILHK